jgi:hypothetical protein
MSTKFEQLLDYLVNEDHEKANELFHEIVVEKSREIYENLIAEEDDEDMDPDDNMDESMEDDEQQDENMDLEDSYMMDADETGDDTDDFGGEISADGDNFDAPMDDEHGHEGQEDSAIMDIKNAIEELEAAFAELERAQGGEEGEMDMDSDDEMDMDSDDEMGMDDEDEGMYMEGRRITREYVEKVGHDWDKNAQKGEQHKMAGAGTGENEDLGGRNTKSIVSSGKGKPVTGASAQNIATQHDHNDQDGVKPHGKASGLVKTGGEFTPKDLKNRPGSDAGKTGFKTKAAGYEYGKKGQMTNPTGLNVGARTGDNENQGERNTRSVESGNTGRLK